LKVLVNAGLGTKAEIAISDRLKLLAIDSFRSKGREMRWLPPTILSIQLLTGKHRYRQCTELQQAAAYLCGSSILENKKIQYLILILEELTGPEGSCKLMQRDGTQLLSHVGDSSDLPCM
jgi:hypothetical protein